MKPRNQTTIESKSGNTPGGTLAALRSLAGLAISVASSTCFAAAAAVGILIFALSILGNRPRQADAPRAQYAAAASYTQDSYSDALATNAQCANTAATTPWVVTSVSRANGAVTGYLRRDYECMEIQSYDQSAMRGPNPLLYRFYNDYNTILNIPDSKLVGRRIQFEYVEPDALTTTDPDTDLINSLVVGQTSLRIRQMFLRPSLCSDQKQVTGTWRNSAHDKMASCDINLTRLVELVAHPLGPPNTAGESPETSRLKFCTINALDAHCTPISSISLSGYPASIDVTQTWNAHDGQWDASSSPQTLHVKVRVPSQDTYVCVHVGYRDSHMFYNYSGQAFL